MKTKTVTVSMPAVVAVALKHQIIASVRDNQRVLDRTENIVNINDTEKLKLDKAREVLELGQWAMKQAQDIFIDATKDLTYQDCYGEDPPVKNKP